MLVDTHCHIHEADYPLPVDEVLKRAHENKVDKMICVGTDIDSSARAVKFALKHKEAYAIIGVHPHNTKNLKASASILLSGVISVGGARRGSAQNRVFAQAKRDFRGGPSGRTRETNKIVGVGEIGLDYFYMHSPKEVQVKAFEEQLDFALQNNLPVSFHVRDAFDDFWPIFDNFGGRLRGVLHSFTDTKKNAQKGMDRGLYIGVNGISTFTKDEDQKALFTELPIDRLLFETDAPFLAPKPWRGKPNEPAFIFDIAKYHAEARGISIKDIASATTTNAKELFAL